jgi:hypothetical protein
MAGYEAVRLFVDRATAVQPTLTLTEQNAPTVAQICRRLDGIPLAIELAATRVKTLSLEHIAARLDQRFRLLTVGSRTALPRQQTLAATVDWSYDLLDDGERRLFERLSVFAGAFTLDAVEAICGESDDVVDLLSNLVGKSLVVAEGSAEGVECYRLLETLRQYGRERLARAGQAEVIHGRHAAYYLRLAEEARPHLFGPGELDYLAVLNLQWDNIRAAMHWYLDHAVADEGLRLAAALEFPIWYRGLETTEGYGWYTQLLGLTGAGTLSSARTTVLLWAGEGANELGDAAAGRRQLAEALAAARQIEDDRLTAWVLHRISRFGGPDHEHWYGATGWGIAEESLARYRVAEDRWGMAVAQSWLGHLAFHRGDPNHGPLLIGAVEIARTVGERQCIAFALRYLGEATRAESDPTARAYLRESLHLYEELGNVWGVACVEYFLGRLDWLHERYAEACAHYRAGLRQFRDLVWPGMIYLTLEGLAKVAAGQTHTKRALRLAAASARLRDAARAEASPIEQAELDRALALVRPVLGDIESGAAWAEGHEMTQERAVGYALADDEAVDA